MFKIVLIVDEENRFTGSDVKEIAHFTVDSLEKAFDLVNMLRLTFVPDARQGNVRFTISEQNAEVGNEY